MKISTTNKGEGRNPAIPDGREKLRLFSWYDRMIVARDEKDVESLLVEQASVSRREVRRQSIRIVQRQIQLTSNDETFASYTPAEVVRICGRGVVPEAG